MPLTPQQIAKINEKKSDMPQALQRDPNVDYYHGWFFVTLNTRDRVPVLSTCVGNPNIADGQPEAPSCVYSEVGKGVIAAWQKMPEICKTVEIDLCEAMPEHFHGLLHLLPGNRRHLGSLISGFLSGCTHAYWDTLGIEWRQNRDQKVSTKERGGKRAYALLTPDRDRDHTHSLIGPALFVHGYNDMEPITVEEVEIKRVYIRDQARKRLIQGDKHACFHKNRHQHSKNWTVERVSSAISTDRSFCHDAARCLMAQQKITARLNTDTKGICLDYLGNKALLGIGTLPDGTVARKLPLVCHRADAWQFEKQKEAVLKAAHEGAVIVSAFISEKERDIKTQLMVEQLPFVEIMDNGFAERYKPVGKAFYALAENRLVQITPWTYLYQKDGAQVSREMCLVMNELARVICGIEDDWWKDSTCNTDR